VIPFRYTRPANADEAVRGASGDARAAFLAGGTTLVDLMKLEVMTPSRLVDVNDLPLTRIENLPGGGLRIGALVSNSALAANDDVKARYPVLSEALLSGASPQLRNMATVGGNLMQRTRCPYFRDGLSSCNKRAPGSGCAAIGGENRSHAVLGTSDRCIATHPADMPVALVALDAVAVVRGAGGRERRVPVAEFHVPYGADPAKESVLAHGELITAVELPPTPWFARSAYVKVRDRASYEFALASSAVAVNLDGGRIREARVAFGGIATKPWRSREAERALAGAVPTAESFRAAGEAALKDARPQKDNAFKVELAKRTLVRALTLAAEKRS
jgi:xanthine dehydrogenase YagS FAD-binding subunit